MHDVREDFQGNGNAAFPRGVKESRCHFIASSDRAQTPKRRSMERGRETAGRNILLLSSTQHSRFVGAVLIKQWLRKDNEGFAVGRSRVHRAVISRCSLHPHFRIHTELVKV